MIRFLTLEKEEFDKFLKKRLKTFRQLKFAALARNFPAAMQYPNEEFWNFQYLFREVVHERGADKVVIDERRSNNLCLIIREGECMISKSDSLQNVRDWATTISPLLRYLRVIQEVPRQDQTERQLLLGARWLL